MFRLHSAFYFLILLKSCFLNIHGSVINQSKSTLSLIADYGYPSEEHKVKTDDDYIVTLYRIPYSPKNNTTQNNSKPVIFLMHGFGDSSSEFVISGSPVSLAFLLSDEGYDVWLGNARGTRYSKEHSHLSVLDPSYWKFDWHEIGLYDIPANVDYILQNTSSSQLQYIGHSQGTTTLFVAASLLPDLKDKIHSAFLMAPVTFLSHSTSPGVQLVSPLGTPTPSFIGNFELLPYSETGSDLSNLICNENSTLKIICSAVLFIVFGEDSPYTNQTALDIDLQTAPGGSSFKQLIHFLQLYNSKRFRQFDYGLIENLLHYKQAEPFDYPINKIDIPIYVYHSEGDALASPKDVATLLSVLPSNTVKKVYKMPFEKWSHIDFSVGKNVDTVLYRIILDDLKEARSAN